MKAPTVLTSSIADGALVPLPLAQVAVTFDQAMWTGPTATTPATSSSVLNPANYQLVATGANSSLVAAAACRCAGTPARARPC